MLSESEKFEQWWMELGEWPAQKQAWLLAILFKITPCMVVITAD